jgi:ABC-2 type transport system permease protein
MALMASEPPVSSENLAPTGPQGEVFDLGYQRYEGPREGRSRARKAIYWDGVKLILGIGRGPKAKILPILLFISAILPAIVFVIILSFAGQGADFLPGPADYNGIIATLLIIFGAIMAPELFTPDRKDRVLDLYLVRPITSTDYAFARVAAFMSIVLALVYSGQVVLQAGLILTATEPWEYIKDNWDDIPRFMAAGFLVALFITAIPMAVATFTNRRAYASAFVIGLFMVATFTVNGLTSETCSGNARSENGRISFDELECEAVTGEAAKYISLLSFMEAPLFMNDLVFDVVDDDPSPAAKAQRELHDGIPIGTYGLYTLTPLVLIWWQYRRARI